MSVSTARNPGERWIALAALALAAVCSYLVWLGWHAPYDVDDVSGRQAGPYSVGQVVGLAVTVLALAALWLWTTQRATAIVNTLAVALIVIYSLDAGTRQTEDANMWLVGVILVGPLLWTPTFVAALLCDSVRRRGTRCFGR